MFMSAFKAQRKCQSITTANAMCGYLQLDHVKRKYIFRRTMVYSERHEMSLSIHRSSLVLLHQSLVRGSI